MIETKEYELGDLLIYEQPTEYIVESTEYDDSYQTPVLTAGKSFIIGYTNETKGIYNNFPVIIFDDFTTSSQYVDFPFKVKSSAMKILSPNKELSNLKYLYYLMQTINFNAENHKRYWISEYSKLKINLPTLEEQQRIVNRIETLFAKLDQAKEKAQNVVDTFETRKASILHKAFSNQLKIGNGELKDEDWIETTIGECGNWYGGGTPNTAVEEYWKDGTVLWITSKDMKSDYIEDTQLHVTQTGIDNSSAKLIKEPAVLFVMRSGILRRTFPVCMVEKEFTVNQDLKALVPFANVNLKFLFYYCKAKEKKILNECMKSGTTVESINAQSLMNLKIKLPPINYQLSIVNFLDAILEKETKTKEAAEAVLEQIDLLKKSILARAFRGEI